jgi:hypothetical protein
VRDDVGELLQPPVRLLELVDRRPEFGPGSLQFLVSVLEEAGVGLRQRVAAADAEPGGGTERREDEESTQRVADALGGFELIEGEAAEHQAEPAETPARDGLVVPRFDVGPGEPVSPVEEGGARRGDEERHEEDVRHRSPPGELREHQPDPEQHVQSAERDDVPAARGRRLSTEWSSVGRGRRGYLSSRVAGNYYVAFPIESSSSIRARTDRCFGRDPSTVFVRRVAVALGYLAEVSRIRRLYSRETGASWPSSRTARMAK